MLFNYVYMYIYIYMNIYIYIYIYTHLIIYIYTYASYHIMSSTVIYISFSMFHMQILSSIGCLHLSHRWWMPAPLASTWRRGCRSSKSKNLLHALVASRRAFLWCQQTIDMFNWLVVWNMFYFLQYLEK